MLAETQPEGAAAKLSACLERLTDFHKQRRFVDFMMGLIEFHVTLVEVSGNRTLLFLTQMLRDLVSGYQIKFFVVNDMDSAEQAKRVAAGVRSFRKLIDLIDAGDANGAEAHWRLHLANANRHWRQGRDGMRVVDVFA
jgi:DNA-binding FadR family transcriptional regulator